MDDNLGNIEPEPLSDSSSLQDISAPDISADNFMNFSSESEGATEAMVMDQQITNPMASSSILSSAGVPSFTAGDSFDTLDFSSPSNDEVTKGDTLDSGKAPARAEKSSDAAAELSSTEGESKKSIEQWLVEQLEPIVEANTAHLPPGTSPPTDKAILFPRTFSGLIAERALAAFMSEMSLVGSSTGDSSDVRVQGEKKDSTRNQSRRGMKYNVTCKQCGEKKTKCVCPTKIDVGVTADPHSVRFNLTTERCIVVKEPGGKSVLNCTDGDKRRETAN